MREHNNRASFSEYAYAIKAHDATCFHYDLRLACVCGVLSWALPVGPCFKAGVPREAIEMEDHERGNIMFEGVHRTGTIMLWDRGTWEPQPGFRDITAALEKGILRFTLYGEKLKGRWILMQLRHTGNRRPRWTLMKEDDLFARKETIYVSCKNFQTA